MDKNPLHTNTKLYGLTFSFTAVVVKQRSFQRIDGLGLLVASLDGEADAAVGLGCCLFLLLLPLPLRLLGLQPLFQFSLLGKSDAGPSQCRQRQKEGTAMNTGENTEQK